MRPSENPELIAQIAAILLIGKNFWANSGSELPLVLPNSDYAISNARHLLELAERSVKP